LLALISFSSWSPRSSSSAKVVLPSSFSLITAIDLDDFVEGEPRNSATSAQAILPGVATFSMALRRARACRGQCLGQFDVGGVIRVRAEGDVVFAGIGQHVEFMRAGAADRAGVGRDGAEFQAQAGEDAAVGVVHVAVFALQVGERGVEGVAVLHQELAAAHDAEAGADFVAELGLDLVEVNRQLAVALDVAAHDVGDDFLVRRADDEFALVAVLEAQQFRAVLLPAAGFLPQFERLHGRHQQFQRAGIVHFLAHDVFDLAQHAQAERHPGVDAGGGALDVAGAQHQLLADDFGVAGASLRVVKKNCEVRMGCS
jgi:hypothetical protein